MDEEFSVENLFEDDDNVVIDPRIEDTSTQVKKLEQQAKPIQQPAQQQAIAQPIQTPVQNQNQQQMSAQLQQQIANERQAFGYSIAEWQKKEDEYIKKLKDIKYPIDMKPIDLEKMIMLVDALMTDVMVDNIEFERKLEAYETQIKIEELALYNTIQTQSSTKLTVDNTKSLVREWIKTHTWDNTVYSLYTLKKVFNDRHIFTTNILKSLKDKQDRFVTQSGLLKMEVAIGNISSNAPTNVPNNNQGPLNYGDPYYGG